MAIIDTSPVSEAFSPRSQEEEAKLMQQATIPAAGSRKALAKWMGEVDGHKSFETSARAVNTQQDRWFTGRRRAVTRATKRPPASFVASPILARASRGNTPISSQRRELSRSLTGSTSPTRQLGPFSPGRDLTNRAGSLQSLRPVMNMRVGTADTAGGRTYGAESFAFNGAASLGSAAAWFLQEQVPRGSPTHGRRSSSVPPPMHGEDWVEGGTDWAKIGDYYSNKRSSVYSIMRVDTPVSPLRPISRARDSFRAGDRYTELAGSRSVKTPSTMRRQSEFLPHLLPDCSRMEV